MATPRKHWFKVADSIAREAWTNDDLAIAIRLMALLNGQWARDGLRGDDACRVTLRPADLMQLTNANSVRSARDRALKASKSCGFSAQLAHDPRNMRALLMHIYWPKYAEFQGMDARESPSPKTKTKTKTKTEERRPETASPIVPPASSKIKKPASFSDEARVEITAWAAVRGYDRAVLNGGLALYRDWEPLTKQTRTLAQWVGAYKRITREAYEAGQIKSNSGKDHKPAGPAYEEWKGYSTL